jgi:hypothetical protein
VWYLLAADFVLTLHFLFVAFVILGLVLVLLGGLRRWHWVGNAWFRGLHLLAIATVVLQSWLGLVCPLTNWEMGLRLQAGGATYSGTFVSHWLQTLLYYQAPPWVFIVCYSVFGALVLVSWFFVRPRSIFSRRTDERG